MIGPHEYRLAYEYAPQVIHAFGVNLKQPNRDKEHCRQRFLTNDIQDAFEGSTNGQK